MNLYGLTWTKDVSKICGVFVGNGDFVAKIWDSVNSKFDKVINLNKTRNLRLKGESIILNVLGLSKLWYVGAVYSLDKIFYVNLKNYFSTFCGITRQSVLNVKCYTIALLMVVFLLLISNVN